ncbi:MAG: hypothetical protein VX777_04505 [Chlamydiota bacterium]|nr:hypothetical protein [Chlamydiota bacterium]
MNISHENLGSLGIDEVSSTYLNKLNKAISDVNQMLELYTDEPQSKIQQIVMRTNADRAYIHAQDKLNTNRLVYIIRSENLATETDFTAKILEVIDFYTDNINLPFSNTATITEKGYQSTFSEKKELEDLPQDYKKIDEDCDLFLKFLKKFPETLVFQQDPCKAPYNGPIQDRYVFFVNDLFGNQVKILDLPLKNLNSETDYFLQLLENASAFEAAPPFINEEYNMNPYLSLKEKEFIEELNVDLKAIRKDIQHCFQEIYKRTNNPFYDIQFSIYLSPTSHSLGDVTIHFDDHYMHIPIDKDSMTPEGKEQLYKQIYVQSKTALELYQLNTYFNEYEINLEVFLEIIKDNVNLTVKVKDFGANQEIVPTKAEVTFAMSNLSKNPESIGLQLHNQVWGLITEYFDTGKALRELCRSIEQLKMLESDSKNIIDIQCIIISHEQVELVISAEENVDLESMKIDIQNEIEKLNEILKTIESSKEFSWQHIYLDNEFGHNSFSFSLQCVKLIEE